MYLNQKKQLEIPCQMFLPVFNPSKIMIAGSGAGTYIKQMRISQTEQVQGSVDHSASIFGINNQKLKPREQFECCTIF